MVKEVSAVALSFNADWSKHHSGRQPIGWMLRSDKDLPWVRFHALPSSKRYAETDEEMTEILARGNILATELLGSDSDCWVIFARWDEITGPGDLAGSWREDSDDPESAIWYYFVQKQIWSAGNYDAVLAEIADDAPFYAVWFDGQSGRVFAPYDGGFDLFPGSLEAATELRGLYPDWLSDRDDGL